MKTIPAGSDRSESARRRLLSVRGEPLFYANWDNAVFIHYEADPEELQKCVPYDVDLFEGRAFVSLVAFTMRRMRPRFGGPLGEVLFKPIATHDFLNIRTYVTHRGETGIYFMSEWLSNRVNVLLGPLTFGLPYRFGLIDYRHDCDDLRGDISANEGQLSYRAGVKNDFAVCEPDSLIEFLLERYTAFTQHRSVKRFFRIWHEPWRQAAAMIDITADNIIGSTGDWWQSAHCVGANYSRGADVWMGWPHKVGK